MTEQLVDPLKIHTFGVKRPLEEKKEEIEKLYNNNFSRDPNHAPNQKRYYPKNIKGDLDEWGAVIKNQNEMFTRIDNIQRMDKRKHMEKYSQELAQESTKRTLEQKYNEDQQK